MKQVLILGGAGCVWDDIESLNGLICDVAAVNDIGAKWPFNLVFWASLHPRKFERWEKDRQINKYPAGYKKYGNKYGRPLVDYVVTDWGGSSGLFAVKIARSLGYEKIILAGVPMEAVQGHFFNKDQWMDCIKYQRAWLKYKKEIAPFVRSCSGWTKALFGGVG